MHYFSFHGCHSGSYSMHAKDTLEAIVDEAYKRGGKVIGITEHMPRTREQDMYPEEVGKMHLLEPKFIEYAQEAHKLKDKYKGKMEIIVGFECEYISDCPGSLEYVKQWKTRLDFAYFVGSIHHVKGIPIDINMECYNRAVAHCGGEEQLNITYYDEQLEMLKGLLPVTVGHFDVIRLFKTNKDDFADAVWDRIIRNVDFIASYGGIVEINTKAYKKGLAFPYPHPKIIALMQARGIRFTLADDSHAVSEVFQHYDRVYQFCKDNHISHLHLLRSDLTVHSLTIKEIFEYILHKTGGSSETQL